MNDTRLPSSDDALRRRTVLTGAAWSVPVIGIALATPAAAASAPAPVTGTIAFSPARYFGVRRGDRVEFPPLTGIVTISEAPMPAKVFLTYSDPSAGRVDLRRDAGIHTPVDPTTGRFEFSGVYNSITGGDNPFGFAYAGVEKEDASGFTFGFTTAELIG